MDTADRYRIVDERGVAVPPTDPVVISAAAVRAILCLRDMRRLTVDSSSEELDAVEERADHIIRSAGLTLPR